MDSNSYDYDRNPPGHPEHHDDAPPECDVTRLADASRRFLRLLARQIARAWIAAHATAPRREHPATSGPSLTSTPPDSLANRGDRPEGGHG